MSNQPLSNKNTIQNSTVAAGGNIHIGDNIINNPNPKTPSEPEKPKNTKDAVISTVLIAAFGIGIGFLGEMIPDDLKTAIETWVTAYLHIPFWKFWLLIAFALVLLLLWLTWKDALGTSAKAKTTAKDFEPEIRDWLKKRYQNRLDQKMAGRLPINLRRIDFSENAAQIAPKQFKAIAPEDVEAELTEFFKAAEGRLLVVGVPGAGKTTLLLQLAVGLLETQPDALPAVVNLATWSKEFKTLNEWLKKILPVEFGVSTALAVRLLSESRVILMFDGLDEIVDAEQRKNCLEAIDLFVSPVRPRREFAISSRTQEFRDVGRVPLVSFSIEIGELTMPQIELELTRRDPTQPEDRDLLAALRADPLLCKAAETPFYFNCLQLLFGENRRPVFGEGEQEEREREILDVFIGNELEKCTKPETRKWISFLADRMSTLGLVRFDLMDLQFNWGTKWWTGRDERMHSLFLTLPTGFFLIFLIKYVFKPDFVNTTDKFPTKLNFLIPHLELLFWSIGLLIFLGLVFDRSMINSLYRGADKNQWKEKIIWNTIKFFEKLRKILKITFPVLTIVLGCLICIFLLKSMNGKVGFKFHSFRYLNLILLRFFIFCFFVSLIFSLFIAFLWTIISERSATYLPVWPYERFSGIYVFSLYQHFSLRKRFSTKGLLPFQLVNFLNEMASYNAKGEAWEKKKHYLEQKGRTMQRRKPLPSRKFTIQNVHLMESDGASWRFRHRLIQEWFAEKWKEEPQK